MSAAALARRARAANAAADTRFGKYVIGERLGMGGMATVHRATIAGKQGLRRPLALKRLLPHLAGDMGSVTAFVDEARLASHLRHPNVVQTLDFGQIDGQYFIAMEFIAGPTLAQLVKQCAHAAGAMPIAIVINIVGQILDGLDHAHNLCDATGTPLGIIHRDVTPPNVIVSGSGVAKLIDFGIAKITSSRRTQTGIVKGKLAYLAPEYTHGQLDHRADLFAVGVVAHELLAGKPLFEALTDYSMVANVRAMPISAPSRHNAQVPHELDAIVMTALERDPNKRWQTASAMRIALASFANDQRITLSPGPVAEWVEWAFTQQPRKQQDTTLNRVIDALAEPSPAKPSPSPAKPQPPRPPPKVFPPRGQSKPPPPPPAALRRPEPFGKPAAPKPQRAQPVRRPVVRPPAPRRRGTSLGWLLLFAVSAFLVAYYVALASGI